MYTLQSSSMCVFFSWCTWPLGLKSALPAEIGGSPDGLSPLTAWEVFETVLSPQRIGLRATTLRPRLEVSCYAYTRAAHCTGISYRALWSPTCWQLTLAHGRLKCLMNYQTEASNCKPAFDYDILKTRQATVPRGLGKLLPKVTGSIKIGKGSHSCSSNAFHGCPGTRLERLPTHNLLRKVISRCSQKMMCIGDAKQDCPCSRGGATSASLADTRLHCDAAKHPLRLACKNKTKLLLTTFKPMVAHSMPKRVKTKSTQGSLLSIPVIAISLDTAITEQFSEQQGNHTASPVPISTRNISPLGKWVAEHHHSCQPLALLPGLSEIKCKYWRQSLPPGYLCNKRQTCFEQSHSVLPPTE